MALSPTEVADQIKEYTEDIDNIFIDFSGGKYSLVLLHLALKSLRDMRVVYIDTTITIPENREYVKELQSDWGFELSIISRKDKDFWKVVRRWGFPHTRLRWCMREFKSIPLKLFNKPFGFNCIHLTGTTMNESTMREKVYSIRGKLHFNYSICSYVLHPLLTWNEEMINEYIRKHELPINPCYSVYGSEGNCYYCPHNKSKEYYIKLARTHPELFNKIVETEKSMKRGGAAVYIGKGEVMYLSKLVY